MIKLEDVTDFSWLSKKEFNRMMKLRKKDIQQYLYEYGHTSAAYNYEVYLKSDKPKKKKVYDQCEKKHKLCDHINRKQEADRLNFLDSI